eukprot:1163757-Amphidinium_carterae.1
MSGSCSSGTGTLQRNHAVHDHTSKAAWKKHQVIEMDKYKQWFQQVWFGVGAGSGALSARAETSDQ